MLERSDFKTIAEFGWQSSLTNGNQSDAGYTGIAGLRQRRVRFRTIDKWLAKWLGALVAIHDRAGEP